MLKLRASLRWLERHETTLAAVILAIAMAASLILVLILWDRAGGLIRSYVPEDPSSPDAIEALAAYSAAGDYYDLIFGVSVAMLSGIVGGVAVLVLTYFGTKAARRQGDVQLLEFVDERTKSIANIQLALLESLKNLNAKSNLSLDRIRSDREALINKFDANKDIGLDELIETDPDFEDLKAVTLQYIEAAHEFADLTTRAGSDRYSEAFAEQRSQTDDHTKNPFLYIQNALPRYSENRIPYGLTSISRSTSSILEEIQRLAKLTKPKEMILAYEACPDTFRTLLFSGAVLFHHKIDLMAVEEARDDDIIDVSINYGGALLLWAIRLLHVSNADIIKLYQQIFTGRAGTLTNYLSAVPLYPIEEQAWMEDFFEKTSDFNDLIVVYVMRGGVPASEPYDPARHPHLDTRLAAAVNE